MDEAICITLMLTLLFLKLHQFQVGTELRLPIRSYRSCLRPYKSPLTVCSSVVSTMPSVLHCDTQFVKSVAVPTRLPCLLR